MFLNLRAYPEVMLLTLSVLEVMVIASIVMLTGINEKKGVLSTYFD